ncbi:MAG: ABC transporter permease [Lachnospiraceae bacterium]|nr:ABC transporter permease [Lachnospiraceae bacterium]
MRINPIIRKDLTITSRSMRYSLGMLAYEGLLMLVFMIAMRVLDNTSRYYASLNSQKLSEFIAMFPAVSIAELCIVALIIPMMAASAVTGEKERQTFDILMTTQIKPMQVVTGKMGSAIIRVMLYVLASVPIMAVGFTLGGISWWVLLIYLVLTLVLAILEASIAVFSSAVCKRTITATIMSYLIVFVICGLTFLPLLMAAIYDFALSGMNSFSLELGVSLATLALLPNPIFMFLEFYGVSLSGGSIFVKSLVDEGLPFMEIFDGGVLWIVLSVVIMLLISFGFMKLAASKIDPMNGKSNK